MKRNIVMAYMASGDPVRTVTRDRGCGKNCRSLGNNIGVGCALMTLALKDVVHHIDRSITISLLVRYNSAYET